MSCQLHILSYYSNIIALPDSICEFKGEAKMLHVDSKTSSQQNSYSGLCLNSLVKSHITIGQIKNNKAVLTLASSQLSLTTEMHVVARPSIWNTISHINKQMTSHNETLKLQNAWKMEWRTRYSIFKSQISEFRHSELRLQISDFRVYSNIEYTICTGRHPSGQLLKTIQ